MANSVKYEPIQERLAGLGWTVELANNTFALKEVLQKKCAYHAALLDVRLKGEDAARVLSSLTKVLPKSCRLLVARGYLDDPALERLENAKALAVVGVDIENLDPLISRLTSSALPGPAPIKYDVNIINCFISSANDVLEYYVGEKPEHGTPHVVPAKKVPAGFVTSVVHFLGERERCTASLACDKAFIVDIASRVNGMTSAEVEGDRDAIKSTVEEMTDQIFGKTELLLSRLGFHMKMGALAVHIGDGDDVVLESKVPVMVIPFTMARKKFYIGFSIQRV